MVNGVNRKNLVKGLIVMGLIAAMGAFFSGCDNNSSPTNNNQQTPLTAEFLIGGVWTSEETHPVHGPSWIGNFVSDTEIIMASPALWRFATSNTIGIHLNPSDPYNLFYFRITIINDNRIRVEQLDSPTAPASPTLTYHANRTPPRS